MTLLTEEEAAEKWCPMGRSISGEMVGSQLAMPKGAVPANVMFVQSRSGEIERHNLADCIGSKCMAWRWKEPPGPRAPDDLRGYCGAFGKVKP